MQHKSQKKGRAGRTKMIIAAKETRGKDTACFLSKYPLVNVERSKMVPKIRTCEQFTLNEQIIPSWKEVEFNTDLHEVIYSDDFIGKEGQFIYAVIWNNRLVYRVIFKEKEKIKELYRYVFYKDIVVKESNDHVWNVVSSQKLLEDSSIDITKMLGHSYQIDLFEQFRKDVVITKKPTLLTILPHVKYQYPKMSFRPFLEVYLKTIDDDGDLEHVPLRILKELYGRKHNPYSTVKITKDLVVATGERSCRYLSLKEQTRVYFDKERAYYFVKNISNGMWQHKDICSQFKFEQEIRERLVDKSIFTGTCGERYTENGNSRRAPYKNRIIYGKFLAQMNYLAAEQAAKTSNSLFERVLDDIYEGRLKDGAISLPKLLGITGPQLKYLKNIRLPRNLGQFGENVNDPEFMEYFPDIKKRMFAVSFYLTDFYSYHAPRRTEITKQEFLAAAKTICSIERVDPEKRYRIADEYKDYLGMRKRYVAYLDRMNDDDPFKQEILAFGEAPLNIKPSKIHDRHNKLGKLLELIGSERTIDECDKDIIARKENEAEYIEYTNNMYSIIMPKDAKDIIREGRILHHCVGHGGYIESMAQGRCRILFLRDNQMIDKPLITIEEMNGAIVQCFGFADSYNSNKAIRDFINEYAKRQGFRIEAKIYCENI